MRTGMSNGCEIEITALQNPVYDIQRFGILVAIDRVRDGRGGRIRPF